MSGLPPIVGLCGAIGAGKDTVADQLVEHFDYIRMGFADKLKEVAADVFGLPQRSVFGTQEQKAEPTHVLDASGQPRTGRRILEMLGTEGFRDVSPTVWVDYAMRGAHNHILHGGRVVFTDVRFPNEFEAIRALDGVVWEVIKVGGPDHGQTGHSSDELWVKETKDNRVVARYQDMDGMLTAISRNLLEGTRSS